MKLKPKLLLGSTVLTVVAVALTTIGIVKITSDSTTEALEKEATNRLIVLRDTQKDNIEGYFKQVNSEVSQQATMGGAFSRALLEFQNAFPKFIHQAPKNISIYRDNVKNYYQDQFGVEYSKRNSDKKFVSADTVLESIDNNGITLQNFYISKNPNPLGSKEELINLDITTDYSKIHAKYHQRFTSYLRRHGFYDVFLVDAKTGNVVYSVFKELDFATSLIDGPYANSGLGEAYRLALSATEPGQTFTTDMHAYFPSYDDFASFISAPIYINGELTGVFIIQMPLDKINKIMTFNDQWAQYGLGLSGETYLVADDKTMRNNSRFFNEDSEEFFAALTRAEIPSSVSDQIKKKKTTIGLMSVDSPGVNKALNGESGFDIFPDYRNIPVLSAYAPLNIPGVNWTILAEIDESEAFSPVQKLINSIFVTASIVGIVVLLIGLFASFLFVRKIVSPIKTFIDSIQRIINGESGVHLNLNTNDEIGELSKKLDLLFVEREATLSNIQNETDNLNKSVIEMLQVAAQLSQGDLTVRMEVAEDVTGTLSDSLNLVVGQTSDMISQVKNTAHNVQQTASEVKNQSETVKTVTEKELNVVNSAVRELKDASNELNNIVKLAKICNETADQTILITDNAQQSVNDSVDGINKIRDNIRETEKRIKRLGERSQEIGGVIDLINGIAEKTHVLALNASMQAASAGEAGRGFAVVANEVQRLAENAREATMEISQQVKNIQVDTADTVTAMNKAISQVVEGSQMAEKSGEQMNTTRDKSHELVKLVQQIAIRSEAQAKVAWNLQKQAAEIKKSSAQTLEQMNNQSQQTEKLVEYSVQLQDAINSFKTEESSQSQAVNS